MFFIMQLPNFKPSFVYQNIGMAVGQLTYAKELINQQGINYGHEFLLFNQNTGSVNVRIPNTEVSQRALDNFPVSEKPVVKAGLTQIEQFTSKKGVTYTNVSSFVDLEENRSASGQPFNEGYRGRLGGEVMDVQDSGNEINFKLVVYSTDKDGKLVMGKDGKPYAPRVIQLVANDKEVMTNFRNQVTEGSNVEVGYNYINKDNITYDDYGFPVGDGDKIDQIEVDKLVVHYTPEEQGQPQQQNPFAQTQQTTQQGGFEQQSNSQQVSQQQNPFAQEADKNIQQQAQQIFGGSQGQEPDYPFGN